MRSPWCNSNRNVEKLVELLKPYHPSFSKKGPSKEELFRQVLPQGKFSESRMGNLLHEAHTMAVSFLVYERFAREPAAQQDMLTKEIQSRALNDWFYKESEAETARLEAKPVPGRENHLYLFRQYHRAYHHRHPLPRTDADKEALTRMDRQLDLFYLLEKAAVLNEMMVRNRLFKDENHAVQTELEKWRMIGQGVDHPAIDLYRLRFEAAQGDPFTAYRQLRDAFLACLDALSAEDCNTHLIALLNDTMAFIKSGRLDIAESLELYQLGLERGVLLPQGKISTTTFTIVVSASNTKGSFDYTAYFLDRYSPCLEADIRPDALAWAKAHTHYWRKELELCLELLRDYTFKKPHFQPIGRVLHTQTYFDLYLQDASYLSYLFSFFDTFERWLRRAPPLSEAGKKAFLRFVQCCRMLADIHAGTAEDIPKLDKLLDDEANVQALNWLRQKKAEVGRLKKAHR